MIRILHTGDVHLDSPFSGLPQDKADRRREESRAVFTSMMTYARQNADLVLITGDLFDAHFVTRSTVALITDELEKVGCPVVISPGNHDPFSPGSVWEKVAFPDNVTVFSSDSLGKVTFDSLGVDVYGYAFTDAALHKNPLGTSHVADAERINLVCAHADMSSLSPYAPLSKPMIEAFGADYAALGHIHQADGLCGEAGRSVYAYCGCPEGRSFDECGHKGAMIVGIEKVGTEAKVDMRPMIFSKKHYEIASVDVTGASVMSDVTAKAEQALSAFDENAIVRLKLTGSVDPSLVISRQTVASLGNAYSVEVRDETVPLYGAAQLENDATIRGEVYRILRPRLESADEREREVALRALKYAMAAMNGESITGD